jgi:hypothetical protein
MHAQVSSAGQYHPKRRRARACAVARERFTNRQRHHTRMTEETFMIRNAS